MAVQFGSGGRGFMVVHPLSSQSVKPCHPPPRPRGLLPSPGRYYYLRQPGFSVINTLEVVGGLSGPRAWSLWGFTGMGDYTVLIWSAFLVYTGEM